jgi:hypothetical protein
MPKRNIVKFEEDGECWIGYENNLDNIIDKNPTLTLKEIINLCDQEAESRNNHGFVCLHRLLAKMLIGEVGEDYATNVMKTIAEYGGLDGMNGCGGEPDAYVEFGLKCDWGDYTF